MKFVTYLRVSTHKQGLGLEAQSAAIEAYRARVRAKILKSFTEVETGRNNARPELAKALHLAKVTGATLVIAKLDRLSRNAAFLLTLRDSGARFVAADLPDANHLTIGFLALIAEQEREAISTRTREALAAAKARGTKLGNPNGARALRRARKGNRAAVAAIRSAADRHATDLRTVLESLNQEGVTSLGAIAKALTDADILTRRGGQWHRSSVRNLLRRLDTTAA